MIRIESTWKPFWTGIIAMMIKSIKQTNLERKNNESKRDWRDKGILWNLNPLYKIKVDPVDYID